MNEADRIAQLESVAQQVAAEACKAALPGGKDCGCCVPCRARKALGFKILSVKPTFGHCESCEDRGRLDQAYIRGGYGGGG